MGQELGKYHITEDGSIYRINNDSSYTYLGNVENIVGPKSPGPKKPKSTGWIWVVFGILLYIIAIISFFMVAS